MDSSQGSSFIPKSPVRGSVQKRRPRKIYVFSFLIYIFFIGTIVAAGIFWFIKYSVEGQLAAVQQALTEERGKFNESELLRVSEVDARMDEAERLLNGQVSVVKILEAIETVTLSSVTMAGFDYEKSENASLTLALNAAAGDFNSARFQRQVISSSPVLAGSVLSNITYGAQASDTSGAFSDVVSFVLEKTIEPGSIKPEARTQFSASPVAPAAAEEAGEVPAGTDDELITDTIELLDTGLAPNDANESITE